MTAKIPEEKLLEDLQSCIEQVEGRLTRQKYHDIGEYSETPLRNEFGSWSAALEAAGLDSGQPAEVTPEMLKRDLRRVTDELGRVPSANEYRDLGNRGVTSQVREFGSWKDAKRAAGIDEEFDYSTWEIPEEDLISELQRLDEELDHPVSTTDIREHAEYAQKTYADRFGSIKDAREAAGLPREIGQPKRKVSREELLGALRRLNERVSVTPSQRLMNEIGEYSAPLYIKEFGTWNDAIREIGLVPNRLEPREVECDYCGELTRKTVGRIERSKRDFCSPECTAKWISESGVHRGENHPNWKGYSGYYGENWEEQRQKALERDDHCCQSCGVSEAEHRNQTGQGLHVHHIIPIREFEDPEDANELENLVALCRQCHKRWEGIPVRPSIVEPAA